MLVRYKNSANKSNIANKGKNTSKVVTNKSASAKGTGIKAKSGKKQAKSSSKSNIKDRWLYIGKAQYKNKYSKKNPEQGRRIWFDKLFRI